MARVKNDKTVLYLSRLLRSRVREHREYADELRGMAEYARERYEEGATLDELPPEYRKFWLRNTVRG